MEGRDTRVEPISRDEARQHLLPDGLFFDSLRVVQRSFAVIDELLDRAGCYCLTLGTDAEGSRPRSGWIVEMKAV